MNRWLTGHTSQRDVLRDMITAVKAKGIKVLFYTQAVEGYTLSAADQAATGWGSTTWTTWNSFINDLYGDLISRYGNDIEGLYFDGDVADTRLLNTIKAANTNLVLIRNGPASIYYDYGDVENNWFYAAGTNAWSAPGMPSAIVMGSTWWATVPVTGANAAKYPPAAIFRYTVLMAGVSNSAGGPAWAAGPYPGGGWEPGVLTTMQAVGAYIAAIGLSITNTYASTAYVTPAGATIDNLQWGVVATRSIDDAYEYIHVLTPPAGKTLLLPPPADRKIFAAAQLLANGQPVTLVQNSAGVRLSLQGTNAWNSVDTVIALTVARVAPYASFSDGFSNGTNGWLFTGGNWSVASGRLSQTNTAGFGYTATVMLGQWADADYEFDFRIVNNGGNPTNWAGCNFRKTNPTDNHTDSGYLICCRANGQICLYTASSGTLASKNTGLAFTNLTHVKIVAAGTNITIYLANSTTPVINFNHSTYRGQGYFSLTTGSASAQFDNVVIAPLHVSAAPPILSPPASQSAVPGQNVSFNVYAGSATPPTYQWQAGAVGSGIYTNLVNGGQISGATSNILTISNVTTNWALDYVVIVSNTSSSVTSAPPATLTMQFLPVITTPPASQGAVAGQTVSFSVTASGTGYQWQAGPVSGPYTNLVDGPQIGGSTTSTLTISSLTTNWLLAYQAVVTAPYGSITSTPPALLTFIQTNYLDFSTTTVGSWSGPVSPANGVTSISGAGLNVGDRVVFDGLVIYTNTNALSGCEAGGAVELNQGGGGGLWGAALGTLAKFSSAYPCFLWINGFGPGAFPGTSGGYLTNRVRIELTPTAAGSTANMNYLVEIDQGLTGTFNSSISGAGVYFSGNTIALTFAVGFCAPDSAEFINYHTPPYSISGTVMNHRGLGLAGSTVYFSSTPNASANPAGFAVTDSSGNYTMPIFNGTWYACAAASNYITSADQMVTMHSSNVANFNFSLAALPTGSGSVTWGAATTVSGDNDVATNGVLQYAVHWGGTDGTVNGVAFTGAGANVTKSDGAGANIQTLNPSQGSLSAAYYGILRGDWWNAVSGQTLTLNNLVPGSRYQVQVWSWDYRAGSTRVETFAGTPSASLLPHTGQYAIGVFTAVASRQAITFPGNNSGAFNAVVVRDLGVAAPPNPTITGFTTNPATGGFILSGNTDIAGNVVVWATTSLAPPIGWIAIQTNEVPGGGFSFTVPGTNSQAFYRLMGQ